MLGNIFWRLKFWNGTKPCHSNVVYKYRMRIHDPCVYMSRLWCQMAARWDRVQRIPRATDGGWAPDWLEALTIGLGMAMQGHCNLLQIHDETNT